MKALTNLAVLTAFAALFMFNGCKARKVTLSERDSTTKITEAEKSHTEEHTADKTKTSDVIISSQNDSTTTTTIITPAKGIQIKFNKDGSFQGEAESIKTTTTAKHNKNLKENKQVNNDVKADKVKDTSAKKQQQTSVHKKDKDVVSTPNYTWIIYVAIGVIILAAAVWWYFKKIV